MLLDCVRHLVQILRNSANALVNLLDVVVNDFDAEFEVFLALRLAGAIVSRLRRCLLTAPPSYSHSHCRPPRLRDDFTTVRR